MTFDNLLDYLIYWTARQPDKLFASFLNIDGQPVESYSYRSFEIRTARLATTFRTIAGLGYGDRALLIYAPGLEVVAAFIACVRIGAIPVITPPPRGQEGRARLETILSNSGARLILTDTRNLGADLPECAVHETTTLGHRRVDLIPDTPNPILFLQYTSGSTAAPKGVIVSHRNVIHNAAVAAHENPVGVSWLPQFHDMGMIGYYLFLIVTGGTTYGFSPQDFLRRPALWFETLSRYRGTITSSPNFGFAYCLSDQRLPDSAMKEIDLSPVRLFMNGAEPIDPSVFRQFQARFRPYGLRRAAMSAAYGLAENTLAVSVGRGGRQLNLDKCALEQGRARPVTPSLNSVTAISCGHPLPGIDVMIVNKAGQALPDDQLGEIWLSGPSTCLGYWNQPHATIKAFKNLLPGKTGRYFRSGDIGFLHRGQLFICGRSKDVVIFRGRNFFAQDLEIISAAKPGSVVAFQETVLNGALILLVGQTPDRGAVMLADIVRKLRQAGYEGPLRVAIISPKAIRHTSSGKLARNRMRDDWSAGKMPVLAQLYDRGIDISNPASCQTRYRAILKAYGLGGEETQTLAQLGLDSLAIVEILLMLESALDHQQMADLRAILHGPLLQQMRLTDLSHLVGMLDTSDPALLAQLRATLTGAEAARLERDHAAMHQDCLLTLPQARFAATGPISHALMTGTTGFLGPFLLTKLLRYSDARITALVRASDAASAKARLLSAMEAARLLTPTNRLQIETRVDFACGDLAHPRLSFSEQHWQSLAVGADTIIHNGAIVDYLMNYDDMRAANVLGTQWLLQLAAAQRNKRFHHISSTIIFGWGSRDLLREGLANEAMEALDFGYAQTKWVAEALVRSARLSGIDARIYRPSFITASLDGIGDASDIVIRLLAFMIEHGVAPQTLNQVSFMPVDIAAHNLARLIVNPDLSNLTCHATVRDYYNLIDVTHVMTREYGVTFRYMPIEEFVRELRRLSTAQDAVFPLLDFITRVHNKFLAMQDKRYSNSRYRAALHRSGLAEPDPSLSQTVAGLMTYMSDTGLISLEPRADRTQL